MSTIQDYARKSHCVRAVQFTGDVLLVANAVWSLTERQVTYNYSRAEDTYDEVESIVIDGIEGIVLRGDYVVKHKDDSIAVVSRAAFAQDYLKI